MCGPFNGKWKETLYIRQGVPCPLCHEVSSLKSVWLSVLYKLTGLNQTSKQNVLNLCYIICSPIICSPISCKFVQNKKITQMRCYVCCFTWEHFLFLSFTWIFNISMDSASSSKDTLAFFTGCYPNINWNS